MKLAEAHLKRKQEQRKIVNNLIEEKKTSLAEGEEEASEEEGQDGEQPATRKRFELNLDPNYWRKKFLYPFALDPAPLRLDASKQSPEEIIAEKKRQKLLGDESLLSTTKYQFPANQFKKLEFFQEI